MIAQLLVQLRQRNAFKSKKENEEHVFINSSHFGNFGLIPYLFLLQMSPFFDDHPTDGSIRKMQCWISL